MLNYCGRSYQVIGNVDRLIDENTGELKTLKQECIMLDRVTCHGCTKLCSRRHYMYWREPWLHRCGTADLTILRNDTAADTAAECPEPANLPNVLA
jgi:hypothetical protein